MQSSKKIALLRPTHQNYADSEVRGVAKKEQNTKTCGVGISIVNLPPLKGGEYLVYLDNEKYPLNDLYGGFFACEESFNGLVAIVLKIEKELIPVVCGAFSAQAKTVWEMIEDEKKNDKEQDFFGQEKNVFLKENYDDEAIALVDYYAVEQSRRNEELEKGEKDDERVQVFNDSDQSPKEEKKDVGANTPIADESDDCEQTYEKYSYYQRVKEQLENIFLQNPKETCLENMVKNSRWVKVGKGENSYVVGLICFGDEPKYICYGVAGFYGDKPSQMENFASFIPKSPFNLKGEGYWVMFQDAFSGESDKL